MERGVMQSLNIKMRLSKKGNLSLSLKVKFQKFNRILDLHLKMKARMMNLRLKLLALKINRLQLWVKRMGRKTSLALKRRVNMKVPQNLIANTHQENLDQSSHTQMAVLVTKRSVTCILIDCIFRYYYSDVLASWSGKEFYLVKEAWKIWCLLLPTQRNWPVNHQNHFCFSLFEFLEKSGQCSKSLPP